MYIFMLVKLQVCDLGWLLCLFFSAKDLVCTFSLQNKMNFRLQRFEILRKVVSVLICGHMNNDTIVHVQVQFNA